MRLVLPAGRTERVSLALAAAVGAAIAGYLALVQIGVVASAWDPVFGSASSARVLHSAFSRALPFPDAALGAAGYVAEVVLLAAGGRERFRTRPWTVLAYAAVAAALACAGAILVALQAFVIRAGCALCLASAAVSIGIAAAALRS